MEEALSAAAVAAETMPEPGALTKTDREILDFEVERFKYAGVKESLIRERWGFSATRYYARLNWLLDQPAALSYAPVTVKRLQRLRDARQRQRVASGE